MSTQSIANLKQYFKTGAKPTEAQFANLIDSFFHKEDTVPAESIEGINALIAGAVLEALDDDTGRLNIDYNKTEITWNDTHTVATFRVIKDDETLSTAEIPLVTAKSDGNFLELTIGDEVTYIPLTGGGGSGSGGGVVVSRNPGDDFVTLTDELGNTAKLYDGAKGDKGDKGDTGSQGEKGDTGAAFTYDMFTEDQLAALKGGKGDKGDKGDTGEMGAAGSDGTNAHIVQDLTEDADGTQHLYLRTWTGEDESTATTSPDLMLQVNELSAALQEIIDNYTAETSSES